MLIAGYWLQPFCSYAPRVTFETMESRTLSRLRTVLTARRDELNTTLARLQQELREGTTTHADAADQAVESYDKNTLQQQAMQASRQLRLLGEALQRVESGDYGECVMCGKEIAVARLEAIPWARYCVTCQEFQENLKTR